MLLCTNGLLLHGLSWAIALRSRNLLKTRVLIICFVFSSSLRLLFVFFLLTIPYFQTQTLTFAKLRTHIFSAAMALMFRLAGCRRSYRLSPNSRGLRRWSSSQSIWNRTWRFLVCGAQRSDPVFNGHQVMVGMARQCLFALSHFESCQMNCQGSWKLWKCSLKP